MYGPAPSVDVPSAAGSGPPFGPTIAPTRNRCVRTSAIAGSGLPRSSVTVLLPVAVADLMRLAYVVTTAPFEALARSMDLTTSAAVTGCPSLNLASGRRVSWKVVRVLLVYFHEDARPGERVPLPFSVIRGA